MSIRMANDIKKLQETVHQQGLMIVQLQQRVAVLEQARKGGRPRKVNTLQDVVEGTVA